MIKKTIYISDLDELAGQTFESEEELVAAENKVVKFDIAKEADKNKIIEAIKKGRQATKEKDEKTAQYKKEHEEYIKNILAEIKKRQDAIIKLRQDYDEECRNYHDKCYAVSEERKKALLEQSTLMKAYCKKYKEALDISLDIDGETVNYNYSYTPESLEESSADAESILRQFLSIF